MFLTIEDIIIIVGRLFLELVSYYNAKIMYALKGISRISPVLTLYITHSMGMILFFKDIIKHKARYAGVIKKDTGINARKFVYYVAFLSLFYNLCHIPKFYAMNYVKDVSIVSIYGSSVLFTYMFAVAILNSNVDKIGIFSLLLGTLGIFLLLKGDVSLHDHTKMTILLFFSSMFAGLYGVLFKIAMEKDKVDMVRKQKKIHTNKSDPTVYLLENKYEKEYTFADMKSADILKGEKENKSDEEEFDHIYNNRNIIPNEDKYEDFNLHLKEKNIDYNEIESSSSDCIKSCFNSINKEFDKFDDKAKSQFPKKIKENNKSTLKFTESNENRRIDFFAMKNDKLDDTVLSSESQLVTKEARNLADDEMVLFGKKISGESKRKILFMRHYIALTGLITFLCYWPGILLIKQMDLERIDIPIQMRPLIHIAIANVISLTHNVVYFFIVCSRSPLFAQISGIIMQPTFLFIQIARDSGISCIYELVGCVLSFSALLMLSNRH